MNEDIEPEGLFRVLEGIERPVTPSQAMSLATMLRAWSRHVHRFHGGLHSTPIRDAVIWGADDYLAALTMRSRIEDTRGRVPTESQVEFDAWLGEIDSDYRRFTEPDEQGLLV